MFQLFCSNDKSDDKDTSIYKSYIQTTWSGEVGANSILVLNDVFSPFDGVTELLPGELVIGGPRCIGHQALFTGIKKKT